MVQGTDDQDPNALRARVRALEAELAALKDENARLARHEQASQAQQQVLQAVLDESPDVIVVKDHAGNFLLGNKVVAHIYGTTPDAMVGKHDGDFSATPEQAEFFRQNVLGIMARMQTEIVLEQTTDDETGEVRSFRSIKKPFQGPDGLPRILVIAHDVTDLQRAQARVAESEQRLQYVLAATGEGVWDWDVRSGRLQHNQRWYELLGYDETELSGTLADFQRCLLDDEQGAVFAAIEACHRGEGAYHQEHSMRRKDGRVFRVLDRGDVVERDADGKPLRMVGSFADITAQVEAREAVGRSLREKETLLKEIHHRVKNNLQIISSLLTLQADNVVEERARGLLVESVARVRSMALIHQKLYLANDLAHIDFDDYARTLVRELTGSLAPDTHVEVDTVPVPLTVELAVPFGLMLNELVTNALKHGRAADGRLDVAVELRRAGDGFALSVRDRGRGLPEDLAIERSTSLGFKLVHSLVKQVRATLAVERTGGTCVRVTMPAAPPAAGAPPP
jgi:PAS domain S-box-containing protein